MNKIKFKNSPFFSDVLVMVDGILYSHIYVFLVK